LFISALIAVVLATFLWAAYQGVRRTLVETAAARAREIANQIAALLVQGGQQRRVEMLRVAADPALREYLQHRGDPAAARVPLASLALPNSTQSIELWTDSGERVLSIVMPPEAAATVPAGSPPSMVDRRVLRVYGKAIYSEAFVPVTGATPTPGMPASTVNGFLMIRRPLAAAGSDALNRLIGSGAAIEVGNKSDEVWTDLAKQVAPPAVDLSRPGVAQYRVSNGQRRMGVLAEIGGDTPLAVWLDFPESTVLAPALSFLRLMGLVALAFIGIAAVATSILSARITRPLHELTEASEAIAAGQYTRRVATKRRDEIGRLGAAFNAMATQVHGVQRELEEKVQQRTARLEETSAALEQRLRELNATRAELDRFFALSLDMLCIAGTDGYFKRLNPAWTQTLGWTDEELRARPYVEFVHPDDRADTIQRAAVLADGTTVVAFENRYQCRDGSYRWLQWKAIPAGDGGSIYTSTRDVTEQKARESHIETLNGQLALRVSDLDALTGELEAFSYSVSHDLRAPLRHVTGFASLLERSAGSRLAETETRYLRTIVEAAGRMGRLIDDLLAFSRMGRAPLARQRVSLDALVQDARKELDGAPARAIDWTVRSLPEVDADPAMLRLVLVNLLSNAVKYTGGRDRPAIEVGEDGSTPQETVVYVRDNGVGFDMQYIHKLFGVFQRLHSNEEFEGTGIGLANVRRIVHRHGGRVWAEGAVDRGATFFIALPKHAEEPM
jgi:PAS domain S-box-containing protein